MRKFSKSDAVGQFNFLPRVYNAVEGHGFYKDTSEYNLCGVIFVNNWAYISNNHFLGRMLVADRMNGDVTYFDMREDAEEKIIQGDITEGLSENPSCGSQKYLFYDMNNRAYECREIGGFSKVIHGMHKIFFDFRENFVAFNRESVLNAFDTYFGRNVNEKKRCIVEITQLPEEGALLFYIRRLNKEYKDKEVQFKIKSKNIHKFIDGYSAPGKCTLNAYYFYEIVRSMDFCDIEIQYTNNLQKAVVLKGIKESDDQPEVLFAVAQASVKY